MSLRGAGAGRSASTRCRASSAGRANEITLENVSLRTEESVAARRRARSATSRAARRSSTSRRRPTSSASTRSRRLVPALRGYATAAGVRDHAPAGPLDRMAVDVNVARSQRSARSTGDLTVDATAPERRVAGTRRRRALQRRRRSSRERRRRPSKSDITGQAQIDLALPSGRLPLQRHLHGQRRSTCRSPATKRATSSRDGRIDGRRHPRQRAAPRPTAAAPRPRARSRPAQPLALDLTGRAANVDLRNLPPLLNAPGVPSNLQFAYTLTGRGRVFSGDVQLDESTLAGATIAPGTTAQLQRRRRRAAVCRQGTGQRTSTCSRSAAASTSRRSPPIGIEPHQRDVRRQRQRRRRGIR